MATEHEVITNSSDEFPTSFSASLGAFLMVENIFGLTFNLVVLVVYHLSRRQMTSVGNYIITSLNILDLLVGLSTIPLTFTIMVTSRLQSRLFCYFHEASISFASSASAVNLMMISIDRYDTIITPLKRKLTLKNVKYVLIFIWAISLLGFCTPFFGYGASGTDFDMSSGKHPCFEWFYFSRQNNYFYELYYVILYTISNAVMVFCYFKIFHEAKTRLQFRSALVKATFLNIPGAGPRAENPNVSASKAQERRMTKMTMMIVSTFMICWGPHAALSIAMVFLDSTKLLEELQLWFLALAYFSTVLHPLLYAFMRQNFRQALLDRLKGRRATIRVSPVTESDRQITKISRKETFQSVERRRSQSHRASLVSAPVFIGQKTEDTESKNGSVKSGRMVKGRSISQVVDLDSQCNFFPSDGSMASLIQKGFVKKDSLEGSLNASLAESITGQFLVVNPENLAENLRRYVIPESPRVDNRRLSDVITKVDNC